MTIRVALTFDAEHPDRPAEPDSTVTVVEALERLDVEATFFLQGRWAEAYPALARRIAARHLVGSHSHYHARMPLLSAAGVRTDLRSAEAAIRRAVGTSPRPWFRFPFGSGADDGELVELVRRAGYRSVGWHVEAREWRTRASIRGVIDAVVSGVAAHGDGAIVLLHPWPKPMAGAIAPIVERLRAGGAELVRLDRLELPAGLSPIGWPRPADP